MPNISEETMKNLFIEFLDCVTKFKKLENEVKSGPISDSRKEEINNEMAAIDNRLETVVKDLEERGFNG